MRLWADVHISWRIWKQPSLTWLTTMKRRRWDAGPVILGKLLFTSDGILKTQIQWIPVDVQYLLCECKSVNSHCSSQLNKSRFFHVSCRMSSLVQLVHSLKSRDPCPDYEMVRIITTHWPSLWRCSLFASWSVLHINMWPFTGPSGRVDLWYRWAATPYQPWGGDRQTHLCSTAGSFNSAQTHVCHHVQVIGTVSNLIYPNKDRPLWGR